MLKRFKKINHYQIAVFLSLVSIFLGLFREFLIVGLLGFSAQNDYLQLYLSIFYSIGLLIDPMRLACLNLYSVLPLSKILLSSTLVSLPFCMMVGLAMQYISNGLDPIILTIAIMGSYLNLIAALLIIYKQRGDVFLKAQLINIMPNFVLIPGIAICYYLSIENIVLMIVSFTSVIPIFQCLLLFSLKSRRVEPLQNKISLLNSITVFIRHFSATAGDQLFQIITRNAFFNYGTGYLSIFAIIVRVYAAFRFILIDSFIGSRLAIWKNKVTDHEIDQDKSFNSIFFGVLIASIALIICLNPQTKLLYSSIQISLILICGFYFSTLVRIIYFKINNNAVNPLVVWYFALYELFFAGIAFVLTLFMQYPVLSILWIGYIGKPFAQLMFLRKKSLSKMEPSFEKLGK